MKRILLDTNFLVSPFQLNLDVFEELEKEYPGAEIYTLKSVVQEAKSIEQGKYKDLVEKLLDTQEIEILEAQDSRKVDEILYDLSNDFVIATNDKELRKRLNERSAETIMIRSKKHLEVENRDQML